MEDGTPTNDFGLNTVSEDKFSDFSTGNIGYYQATELERILNQDFKGKTIICMHHKPTVKGMPEFVMDLNIEDRKTMRYFIEKYKIDAVLYGHQDPSSMYTEDFILRNDGVKSILLNANSSIKDKFANTIMVDSNGQFETQKVCLEKSQKDDYAKK